MTKPQEYCKEHLIKLFLVAAEEAALRLRSSNISETTTLTGRKPRTRNILRDYLYDANDLPWEDDSERVKEALRICTHYILAIDSFKPFWAKESMSFMPVLEAHREWDASLGYATDPEEWVQANILRPALFAHLADLPKISSATAETAGIFAEEVISVVNAPDRGYTAELVMPQLHVRTDKHRVLKLDNVTLDFPVERLIPMLSIYAREAILTISLRAPRDSDGYPVIFSAVQRLLVSLKLHGFHADFEESVWVRPDPYWYMDSWSLDDKLPQQWTMLSENPPFTLSALRKVLDTSERLKKYNLEHPSSSWDLSLHHFTLGMSRGSDADAFLDFVIALEALLLPKDQNSNTSELAYRFRLHGAFYLAKFPKERRKTLWALNDLYNLRSRLVHGGAYPSPQEIETGREQAYAFARSGLLRAVQEGFPKASTLLAMILRSH